MALYYSDIKNALWNRTFDKDHAFGNQCWDGYAEYETRLGYPYANCTASGYAKDIWEQRATNGMLNNHVEVKEMQPGDIAVFKECPSTPQSHVAIFDHDAGNGYGWFFGQNQGGPNGAFNVVKLPYDATYPTAFRPKCWINGSMPKSIAKPSKPVETQAVLNSVPTDFVHETATFYPNTTIKIRKAPSLKGVDTGLVYKVGMSVVYDGYVKREGYVWISWISASAKERRWMAAGELNSHGVNVNPYGAFK